MVWLSGKEAAAHLGVSESAIRKQAAQGKRASREVRPGRREYELSDDELSLETAIEAAVTTSGAELLAEVVARGNQSLETAIAAIRESHLAEVRAKDELIAELRAELERERARTARLERIEVRPNNSGRWWQFWR